MSFGDGGLYAGAWDNDARHGKGAMRYANGDAYEGEWSLGRRHGEGRLQACCLVITSAGMIVCMCMCTCMFCVPEP